jgi:prepilin-type N-terminal cleavage/methylation domain-containing protein
MKRSPGFTLLEVMLAIVITGVVALLAYGTASAGFDTRERLQEYRTTTGSEVILRAFLVDALRHPVEPGGLAMNDTLFWIDDQLSADGSPADAVAFLSRGLASPLGASNVWTVKLSTTQAGLRLDAAPNHPSDGIAPITMLVRDVTGLNVEVLDRSADFQWRPTWDAAGRVPAAVKIEMISARAPGQRSSIVVHSALEVVR